VATEIPIPEYYSMSQLVELPLFLAGVVTALVTLPALLELVLVTIRAFDPRLHPDQLAGDGLRLVAVVPAHNEETLVGSCVASLLGSREKGPNFEVVVVADNCTDATARSAREAGARVLTRDDPRHLGKGHALRFAFDQLRDEGFSGFLIVDADSIVSANLVPEIARYLAAGADAVQARYRVLDPLNSRRNQLLDVALLAFNVLRPRGRDAWGISAGILGNGFALSRRTLNEVPYLADSIVEDLEYHLLLVTRGKKVRFADRATVYGAMPQSVRAQSSQRARWEGGRLRVAMDWVPRLAALLFHGDLAAFEPLLELLTLPLAYLAVASAVLCALPFGFFRGWGIALAALLVTHVMMAMALGEHRWKSFVSLLGAPFYVAWKFTTLMGAVRSSSRKTAWIRSER
jgi:cellulose synthase/poly-beta-1,6-N-acetylglucosamine synthase-like glycosyltransferase